MIALCAILEASITLRIPAIFDMASTLEPVSIPLSLAVIALIWAVERFDVSEILPVESGTTKITAHETSKQADSEIASTDVGYSPSKLKTAKPSLLNRPKND